MGMTFMIPGCLESRDHLPHGLRVDIDFQEGADQHPLALRIVDLHLPARPHGVVGRLHQGEGDPIRVPTHRNCGMTGASLKVGDQLAPVRAVEAVKLGWHWLFPNLSTAIHGDPHTHRSGD